MAWTELEFGKHRGKKLPWVVFHDPDWFIWAYEDKVFKDKGDIEEEAKEVYKKACSIRVPQSGEEKRVVRYIIHPSYGKFDGIEIIPESQPLHDGASSAFRMDVIDMRVPRQYAKRDKLGYRNMFRDIKRYVFGDSDYRLTKKKCEEFFDNDDNFVLG